MPVLLLMVVGAIAFWITRTASGRAVFKGTFIYFIIMFPSRRWHLPAFLAPPIIRHEPTIQMKGRTLKPDIYRVGRASKRRRPGIIIYAPLAPEGNRDPYVINFLQAMARIGFVVMVPNWPDRPVGLMDGGDIEELEVSIARLREEPDIDPNRIGVIAVSYGAGPALIVAAKRAFKDQLQYVMTIGGYVDLWTVFRFAGNGKVRIGDHEVWQLQPHPYMRYVLLQTVASWTTKKEDARVIQAFLGKIRDFAAPLYLATLRQLVSKETRDIIDALEHISDGMPLSELRRIFPASFRAKLDELSLTPAMLHAITARILIVHTTNDRLVPYSEARLLRRHLRKNQQPILSTLSGFDHTIPPPATPANFFGIYAPNALKIIPLLYTFFRMQEPER